MENLRQWNQIAHFCKFTRFETLESHSNPQSELHECLIDTTLAGFCCHSSSCSRCTSVYRHVLLLCDCPSVTQTLKGCFYINIVPLSSFNAFEPLCVKKCWAEEEKKKWKLCTEVTSCQKWYTGNNCPGATARIKVHGELLVAIMTVWAFWGPLLDS